MLTRTNALMLLHDSKSSRLLWSDTAVLDLLVIQRWHSELIVAGSTLLVFWLEWSCFNESFLGDFHMWTLSGNPRLALSIIGKIKYTLCCRLSSNCKNRLYIFIVSRPTNWCVSPMMDAMDFFSRWGIKMGLLELIRVSLVEKPLWVFWCLTVLKIMVLEILGSLSFRNWVYVANNVDLFSAVSGIMIILLFLWRIFMKFDLIQPTL